jgi:aldehyde:ferredoxin oxidoreductase
MRMKTGFDPKAVSIPKRFTEITTWKGTIDADYLAALMSEYGKQILTLGAEG